MSITFPEDNILLKINTGQRPCFVLSYLSLIVTDGIWIAASALSKSKCYIYNKNKLNDARTSLQNWKRW